MKQTFKDKTTSRAIVLGALGLLGTAATCLPEDPAPSGQGAIEKALVRSIQMKEEVWTIRELGQVRNNPGLLEDVTLPFEVETNTNGRVLFEFSNKRFAVGENTKCVLNPLGESVVISGNVLEEIRDGGSPTKTRTSSGSFETQSQGTMTLLHAPPDEKGNTKALLVHGEASFKAGSVERDLEPGQMVVVPEDGSEPYCVHVDLEIATSTSKLIQDFKEFWDMEKVQEAIDSQRGRFIRTMPFGLRRGEGPEERRLLFRKKKSSHHHGH